MSESEKAIEFLKNLKEITLYFNSSFFTTGKVFFNNDEKAEIQEVIDLISRQQKELDKKDKIIDLMAEYSRGLSLYADDDYGIYCELIKDGCNGDKDCNKCIKQYFEDKVKKVEDDK